MKIKDNVDGICKCICEKCGYKLLATESYLKENKKCPKCKGGKQCQ